VPPLAVEFLLLNRSFGTSTLRRAQYFQRAQDDGGLLDVLKLLYTVTVKIAARLKPLAMTERGKVLSDKPVRLAVLAPFDELRTLTTEEFVKWGRALNFLFFIVY